MNKKNLLMLATAVLMIFTAVNGSAQEKKGPRVALEDVEVTILDDNGKELKRVLTSEISEERKELDKEVIDRVYKKFGAKTWKEIRDKKLETDFENEKARLIKVRLVKPPRLRFYDSKGNVTREITFPGAEEQVTRKEHKKVRKGEALIKETSSGRAVVSRNGTHALLIESSYDLFVPETEKEKEAIRDTDADFLGSKTRLTYYDASGNILWKTNVPENMFIDPAVISNDGSRVAYIQEYEMGGLPQGELSKKLVVVNTQGEEIFSFPHGYGYGLYNRITMSPNGRYIAINVRTDGKDATLFFDLETKASWQMPNYYLVEISNQGMAYLDYPVAGKAGFEIDLKNYLGVKP